MNPRHAVSFAILGWYLMMPPTVKGWYFKDWDFFNGVRVDETAPLSRWETVNAFDSAEECRNYRVRIRTEMDVPSQPDYVRRRAVLLRCVASDDPRLVK